jgi:ribonuclease HI
VTYVINGEMTVHCMQFDGSARPGNPGLGGAGAIVYRPDGRTVEIYKYLWNSITNNVAEYEGLILGLEACHELGAKAVHVYGDSMLVVRQVKGLWKVKGIHLRPLCDKARKLVAEFETCPLEHVLRAGNEAADALANRAVDEKADSYRWIDH